MKTPELKTANLSFEEAYAELERIVQVLDTSDATLADSISLSENGQLLIQHCSKLLKEADLKMQILSNEENPSERSGT
ncbi:MAG: exodeoxyribonuclease VII small subunit [Anaerolineaceae bacterium]|nr:exodeoxyribonuclease VII small subunit [Anaerolineaceae bacterium]